MILSVSVDLDPLWCYRRVYGLPERDEPDPIAPIATRRFCQLARDLGVRGTLFVVGTSLDDPETVEALLQAQAQGHEIANHTLSHRYDLSKLSPDEIRDEVARGADVIERKIGVRPRGFRAPGYLLGPRVLPAAAAARASYDSSILPSPLYQGIKAAAMGFLRVTGQRSGAVLGDPREALGPTQPYRPDPDAPYRVGKGSLIELPITTLMGVPLIGATLVLTGPSRVGWLASMAANLEHVCLELHGIDFMDISADSLDPALSVQGDFSVPRERKAEAFSVLVRKLLGSHESRPLAEAAAVFAEKIPQ